MDLSIQTTPATLAPLVVTSEPWPGDIGLCCTASRTPIWEPLTCSWGSARGHAGGASALPTMTPYTSRHSIGWPST